MTGSEWRALMVRLDKIEEGIAEVHEKLDEMEGMATPLPNERVPFIEPYLLDSAGYPYE